MKRDFDLSGAGVHIGIPCYGDMSPQTTLALVETVLALAREHIAFNVEIKFGCCYVDQVRNFIADSFLKTQATHLFMIDSDMVWHAADFLRVLAHATINPVVAATYRMKNDDESYAVNIAETATANEFGCIPAGGMGLGFCCVQRQVIEKLHGISYKVRMGGYPEPVAQIFSCDRANDWYRGEDIKFFADCVMMGFEPWLDLEVNIGHIGRKDYRGSFARMLDARCRDAQRTDEHKQKLQEMVANGQKLCEALGKS